MLFIGMAIGGDEQRTVTSPDAPNSDQPDSVRNRDGAVATAAQWLDAVDTRQELLDAEGLRRSISTLVAADARVEMTQRLANAGADLRSGDASPTTVRSAPLGYRLLSFTPDRSVVGTWEIVARGAPDIAPSVLWARSELVLVWEDGWKLSATRVQVEQPDELTAADMAGFDGDYTSFRHVP